MSIIRVIRACTPLQLGGGGQLVFAGDFYFGGGGGNFVGLGGRVTSVWSTLLFFQ